MYLVLLCRAMLCCVALHWSTSYSNSCAELPELGYTVLGHTALYCAVRCNFSEPDNEASCCTRVYITTQHNLYLDLLYMPQQLLQNLHCTGTHHAP